MLFLVVFGLVFGLVVFLHADLILKCSLCRSLLYSGEATGRGRDMIWKAQLLHAGRKATSCLTKSINSKIKLKKSPYSFFTFLILALLSSCSNYSLLLKAFHSHCGSAVRVTSLLIKPEKTLKVTKHLQDCLWFLSLPFNSPWAVINYRVNPEDLITVSWGKKAVLPK